MKKIVFLISFLIFISFTISDHVESPDEVRENPYVRNDDEVDETVYNFSQEWETKMANYEPDYVYMIPLNFKETRKFYEKIHHVPATIKGAFITDDDKKIKIAMKVISPSGRILLQKVANQYIFEFDVTEVGRHKIYLTNKNHVING